MRTTAVLSAPRRAAVRVKFKYRDWHVSPDANQPNRFHLKETKTGKVLGTFILSKNSNPALLNLIASAPELQDIAEMYRDTMMGNKAEKSMVFSIVTDVLQRFCK